jgi:hypothetical protein
MEIKVVFGKTAVVAAFAALVSPAALAAGFDGQHNLVCAATDVVACADGPGCAEARASVFELPDFMYVDFKNKRVFARSADAQNQVESPVRNLDVSEEALIIQGVENHQGWTLWVDRNSGRMTTSVSGGEANYVIFGVCTAI